MSPYLQCVPAGPQQTVCQHATSVRNRCHNVPANVISLWNRCTLPHRPNVNMPSKHGPSVGHIWPAPAHCQHGSRPSTYTQIPYIWTHPTPMVPIDKTALDHGLVRSPRFSGNKALPCAIASWLHVHCTCIIHCFVIVMGRQLLRVLALHL